jgi:hypothetical protein
MHFIEAEGSVLKEASCNLKPGQSAFLGLDAMEVDFGRATR